jgi:hypothetical protein
MLASMTSVFSGSSGYSLGLPTGPAIVRSRKQNIGGNSKASAQALSCVARRHQRNASPTQLWSEIH